MTIILIAFSAVRISLASQAPPSGQHDRLSVEYRRLVDQYRGGQLDVISRIASLPQSHLESIFDVIFSPSTPEGQWTPAELRPAIVLHGDAALSIIESDPERAGFHVAYATCPWNADLHTVRTQLEAMQASGGTALHDAVFAALTLRNHRADSRGLVLLFTDGEDTAGWLPGQNVIDVARRSETVVYGVGLQQTRPATLGYRVDFRSGLQPAPPHLHPSALADSFVERVAAETGGRYLDVEDIGKVRDAFVGILAEFRTRYLLSYVPAGVPASGWHPIDVRVRSGPSATVRARRGYFRNSVSR